MRKLDLEERIRALEENVKSLNKGRNAHFLFINDVRDKAKYHYIFLSIWLLALTLALTIYYLIS